MAEEIRYETYIVVEASILIPEHIQISERVVRREILKLYK